MPLGRKQFGNRSPKAEPEGNSSSGTSTSAATDEGKKKAGSEILDALLIAYRDERGIHAETIIGAAAALAGDFALRGAIEDAGITLPEKDSWVVGGVADPVLYGNEQPGNHTAWSVIRAVALRAGAAEADLPNMEAVVARTTAAVGGSPFPPLTLPSKHYPKEWSPNACPRFRPQMDAIAERNGLSKADMAGLFGVVIGILIEQTKEMLSPAIAATLAAEVMIGVARMAPLQREVV
jgi:hypothetical protein